MVKNKEISRLIYVILTTIIILCGMKLTIVADDEDLIIEFPDSNLKNALIEIGVDTDEDGEITRGEMLACKSDSINYDKCLDDFDLEDKGITDLTGLEYAENITYLNLNKNDIKDLSPISKLKELGILTLNNCDLSNVDINPIMQLNKLKILSLTNCNIDDLSAFEHAAFSTELISLELSFNYIKDISPLKNLIAMREIFFIADQIEDISALENMDRLYQVSFHANNVREIDSLKNKTVLAYLNLEDNDIEDISPIESSVKLINANLAGNRIKNIAPLKNMKEMTYVELSDNEIEDITLLKDLVSLDCIGLMNNKITDISPLADISNLTEIIIDNNDIEDISSLERLNNLSYLSIENNNISDISALANLTNLKKLYILGNDITDLSPIKGLDLEKIDMTEEHIAELSLSGVEDGKVYDRDVMVTFEGGTGTYCPVIEGGRNNPNIILYSGDKFTNNGSYIVRVTHITGKEITVEFTIDKNTKKEQEKPIQEIEETKVIVHDCNLPILGVIDDNVYNSPVTIFFEGTGELNGNLISNGERIEDNGDYTLKVTKDNKYRKLNFSIKKQLHEQLLFGETQGSTPSEWAKETIKEAYEKGLLFDNVTKEYKDSITRKDFCNLMVKLFEKKNMEIVEPAPMDTFIDTQDKGILQAYQLNIINGIGEKIFDPMGTLTREQMAVIADKFLCISYDKYDHKNIVFFNDEQNISTWAIEAVNRLTGNNVLNGVGNNMFAPKKEVTKEQAIAMIYKLYKMNEFGLIHSSEDYSIYIKKYGDEYMTLMTNNNSITLPPYSAIYLYNGMSDTSFEEEIDIDDKGNIVLANYTNQYMIFEPLTLEYPIIYRTENKEGPYIRTAIIDPTYNKEEGNEEFYWAMDYIRLITNWQDVRTGLYYDK
ncbi:hypothetical protein SH1V18_18760 [Vallitalea longa]|uniref:SLH domain-containing protein n=1 Tax=Vallitalea longa TaxID=2936439 RepID=A0A9W5YBE2_9FIRM|nr:leucine-rich repeat domain-containing protein [Vallitalea longa]GKX29396.1 hypothetical protein SH1V18_18760 [Vallitalea longa]